MLGSEATSNEDPTIELLRRVPVFEALDDEDLAKIADVTVPRHFVAGQVIFHEGDRSDTAYIVQSGTCRAVRQHADGRAITLAHFSSGDIFGELAIFDTEKRSATIEALDKVSVLAVLATDVRRLMREYPDISLRLAIALSRRLREANDRLARQSFQTVQSRVAGVLAELVKQSSGIPEGQDPVPPIEVRITQADIAQLAGSSRESASRFLAVLERAKVVKQGRGRITVLDPGALKRYVY